MDSKLLKKIIKREEEGTYRSLSSFGDYIDFLSNDYLGASKFDFQSKASSFGSTGSRLISGSNKFTESCEKNISEFFGTQKALVFNSGYDANIGFFSAIPQKGDTVIYDEHIHASIRDGVRLSYCDSYSFRHNDIEDLKRKIKLSKGTIYVSIESLYSMDGDIPPIKEIAFLCKELDAYLVVDEAHAIGVFGELGKGLVDLLKVNEFVFARLVTFGKAFGSHGAAILGSENLINFLINFSRSFIYTTAMPMDSYRRISDVLTDDRLGFERQKLKSNISHFCEVFKGFNSTSNPKSPVQLLKFGSISKAKDLAERIQEAKIAIKPIFSPTVQKGNEGLRICIHSFNTFDEIDFLYNQFMLD